jgi:LPS sulfotransferase NodH
MSKKIIRCLVVGMRKSGTTWLYDNLKLSPTIGVPISTKETNYFSKLYEVKDINWYHQQFGDNFNKECLCEIDSSLISSREAIRNIKDYNSDMKIIIIKRDLVSFAISRFNQVTRRGSNLYDNIYDEILNSDWFKEEIKVDMYIDYYVSEYGIENIKITQYSDLLNNPVKFFSDIHEFISGEKPSYQIDTGIINPARVSRIYLLGKVVSKLSTKLRKKGINKQVDMVKNSFVSRLLFKKGQNKKYTDHDKKRIKMLILDTIDG